MQRPNPEAVTLSNLLSSEGLLYALISNLPGGAVFVVNRDLRYLLAEGEALAIAGFQPEDFVGRTIFEVLPPELAASYEPLYRQALAGEPFEHEHDTHGHTYISRGTPLCSDGGDVDAVLVVSYDITERKQTEAALRASEARFCTLANTAPALIWHNDAQGDNLFLNQYFLDFTGKSAEEIRGEGWHELIHSDDADAYIADYLAAVRERRPWHNRNRIRRHDGAWRWHDNYAQPLFSADGVYLGHVGVTIDNTEAIAAEIALQESEQRYRHLVELTPHLVWNADEQGRNTYISPQMGVYVGLPAEQLLNLGWETVIHPEDVDRVHRTWMEAVQTGIPYEAEYRLRRADGEYRWHLVRAVFEGNGQGRKWFGVSTDIHDRKRAEAALRKSEEKYRSLFDSIDAGFCIFEMLYNEAGEAIDFRYIETNPAFERQSGRRPHPGQTMRELFPEAEDMWLKDYAEVARTGQAKRFIDHHKDLDRWFDVFVFPTSNVKNQLAALFSDVTDEKRAEAALRVNEERQRFLLQLSDALRSLVDPIEIQEAVTRTAMHHFGADRCYYCEIEGENAIIRRDAARDGLPSVIGIYPLSSFAILQAVIEVGRPFVVQDVYTTNTIDDDLRQLCIQLQVISYINVPVIKDGKSVGVLCLVQSTPRDWTDLEVELAVETAERTWAAVERARAEDALGKSEANYRSLFTTMDQGFCIVEKVETMPGQLSDFRYITVNPAFERHTGLSDVVGKTMRDFVPHAEHHIVDIYDAVVHTRQPQQFEEYISEVDLWFEVEVFPAQLPGQIAILFSNVSARKRAEAQLRRAADMDAFRVKLSDALRSLSDPFDIQRAAMHVIGEYLAVDRVFYTNLMSDDVTTVIHDNYVRDGVPKFVGSVRITDFGYATNRLKNGETVVLTDVNTGEYTEAEKAAYTGNDMVAAIAVPLVKANRWVATLVIHSKAARCWTNEEIAMVQETAERTWAAVERAYAEAALRESELQRVREQSAREQERQRAESLAELDRAKTAFFSNVSHEFRTPLTLSLAPLQDALKIVDEWMSHGVDENPSTLKQNLELVHRHSLRLLKLVNTLLDFSRIEAGRMEAVYEPTDLATFTTELSSVFRSTIERAGLQLIVDCPPLPEPVLVDREMWEKIILNLLSNAFKFTYEGAITVSLRVESRSDLQASTSNIHNLTLDPQSPASELDTPTDHAQTSSSELDTPTSELKTSTLELDTPTSELETSTSKLETSSAELDTPTSNLRVALKIRDTGAGIAPEHLPHLFERFYQVRGTQARTYEGSGIGLALVHELVQLHGGTIEVSSTLGEGTCFTMALPFGTAHLPSDRLQREGAPRSGSVPDRYPVRTLASTAMGAVTYVEEARGWLPETAEARGQRAAVETNNLLPSASSLLPANAHVLVVDDNADMREYLTRILSEQVQVEAVADGAVALAAVHAQVPDLILSDVMMPGLDGFELLEILRADPHTREIPIILLSARAGEEAIVEGLAAGADDYLIKPFSAQELISRVMAHLHMAQLRGEALHEARNTLRSKDEFISIVSHELNTPLVSILGWTRMLRSSPPNPAMLSKALDTIERHATLQGKLVQDLLDFSRISAGKLRLNPQPIELQPVIENAIATIAQTAADKGIDLTWQENVTEPVVVMGDGDRLGQVIGNLLSNAIKFTPKSGNVKVELSVTNNGGAAHASYGEIRVMDTGIGIAADFLPYVFERFRQAEGADSAKGLGLGLAIARHIVELQGGTIHAQSAGEKQGSTFIVKLPLLKPIAHH